MKNTERHSSKGNQLKWNPANTETWYKADYIGYEGLTEYMVSHLLMHSTLSTEDFVLYDTEILRVGKKDYLGCKSSNFLPDGWQLLTLERLFHTLHGKSLYQSIFQFGEVEDRAQFLVDQVIQMTGLKDFGKYLCTLLTIDALFLMKIDICIILESYLIHLEFTITVLFLIMDVLYSQIQLPIIHLKKILLISFHKSRQKHSLRIS